MDQWQITGNEIKSVIEFLPTESLGLDDGSTDDFTLPKSF